MIEVMTDVHDLTNPSSSAQRAATAELAIEMVRLILARADQLETSDDRATMAQLEGVVTDPDGVAFVMAFVDRVIRPDDDVVAAKQLAGIVGRNALPGFLSSIDRALLLVGAQLAPRLPKLVMPLARRRLRSIVGHLVAPADRQGLAEHLATQRASGYALNVNLLGEAVLGEREAERRLAELLDLLDQPDVDYVSVKISAVASQLNHWAYDDSLRRVSERLALLLDRAAEVQPPTFVNVDMEEYHDLDLTLEAFMAVLGTPERRHLDAGIVLQAYLPDALGALQELTDWANRRHADGGGTIKVRLVKGANLAMEKVDAAMHGWEQAPFDHKVEADANYKRCLDWLLTPEHMTGMRLGLASHNLFDVAWTQLVAQGRGVCDRVQFEMLQGMAPAQAKAVAELTDGQRSEQSSERSPGQQPGQSSGQPAMLLYTPAVRSEDFDVAIGYLFRRLEENASNDNFLRHLFELASDSTIFDQQAAVFRRSLEIADDLKLGPRRTQNRLARPGPAYEIGEPFRNEPETDPTSANNRRWIAQVLELPVQPVATPITDRVDQIEAVLVTARTARLNAVAAPEDRRKLLHRVGDQLAERRGELIATMMAEANKTFPEADGEVAEAIDFARYYGDHVPELSPDPAAEFEPLGVVAVIPPWNFPVAIPAGGVLAALAAGNSVVFKPAPETPRCAELVAQACWDAGVDRDLLQFVRTPDNEVGRALVVGADAVILTGSTETAVLFRSWKPDLALFAETSGKNALIITPNADIDLAVADLVRSAFGHSGQKCSAASLAIAVGDVYHSERFRRQLIDAVESLELGPSHNIETTMGPLIGPANDRLQRGLTTLDPDEEWLVEPRLLSPDENLWSPGVRLGVAPDSWFHRTECFGPVLGVMQADDLDQAIAIQNASEFGLTGGIHSLDPDEVARWLDQVEVGNAYVNRHITGAIVQRQPFGGWKRSSIGPGAKAGGPNYVSRLGTWRPRLDRGCESSRDDYEPVWAEHFGLEHDPTGLFCEQNVFRYRPISAVLLRHGPASDPGALRLAHRAAAVCGVPVIESDAATESEAELAARLETLAGPTTGAMPKVERIRLLGPDHGGEILQREANRLGIHVDRAPVTTSGRLELQHYLREQAVSRTLHRFGNLVGAEAIQPRDQA